MPRTELGDLPLGLKVWKWARQAGPCLIQQSLYPDGITHCHGLCQGWTFACSVSWHVPTSLLALWGCICSSCVLAGRHVPVQPTRKVGGNIAYNVSLHCKKEWGGDWVVKGQNSHCGGELSGSLWISPRSTGRPLSFSIGEMCGCCQSNGSSSQSVESQSSLDQRPGEQASLPLRTCFLNWAPGASEYVLFLPFITEGHLFPPVKSWNLDHSHVLIWYSPAWVWMVFVCSGRMPSDHVLHSWVDAWWDSANAAWRWIPGGLSTCSLWPMHGCYTRLLAFHFQTCLQETCYIPMVHLLTQQFLHWLNYMLRTFLKICLISLMACRLIPCVCYCGQCCCCSLGHAPRCKSLVWE